jgi:tetratricopeptide (TPR) repeat protein
MTAPAPRRRLLWLLAPAAAFAATLALLSAVQGGGGAVGPAAFDRPGPADVDVAPNASTAEAIAATRAAIADEPGDAALHAALGDLFYLRGRETADSAWNDRARGAYERALALEPQSAPAIVGLGTLALAKHDFEDGLRHGERALRLAPGSVLPYAAIVDAQVELGRYDDAARSLDRMVSLKPNLASYARVSYFRELHGDLDGALEAMRLAVAAGGGSAENVAYVETLLGNLELQRGETTAAARAFRTALARVPGYLPAETGLATVAAARGDLDAAIERYERVVTTSAVHEYHVLLLEAKLADGRMAGARQEIAAIRENQAIERSRGVNTDAELAIFEADHGSPARAVALGRAAVRAAPSVPAADAYSWALTSAGRAEAALRWAKRALRSGWRDPLVRYHAGMAAKLAGEPALARRWLSQALAQSPRFSPLHAPRARRALQSLDGAGGAAVLLDGRRTTTEQDSPA